MKVYNSLVSAFVLEMCVHYIVCDYLSHSLVVLDESVVFKSPVVAVVVLYSYVETCCMSLETFLCVYGPLRGYLGHAVDVLEVIHKYSCISVPLLG